MAEFIDNAIQAGARTISVDVLKGEDERFPIEILVTDDGMGMDASTLENALTFGGSSRFGDRSSLGRYGMGLPNGALSRARRVELYTWQAGEVLVSRLDVDEMIAEREATLPPVETIDRPSFVPNSESGTLVYLKRCDRLEYKRAATICRRLEEELGRIYRYFLADGLELCVNGRRIQAVDPLFLLARARNRGGRQFGDTLVYSLVGPSGPGNIKVRFSELPVDRWHSLSGDEKRSLGVTSGPCVSVIRAGREIDRGWYFMGGKRRENYDDWWRCEIQFDPALDEHFGITYAKQAIAPTHEVLTLLTPDLEPIARALNGRVRHRFELVKVANPLGAAERQAARADSALPALPSGRDHLPEQILALVGDGGGSLAAPYRIIVAELDSTAAFDVALRNRQLLLLLNARHPLYRDLYGPLARSDSEKDQDIAKRIALAFLAAARAEAGTARKSDRAQVRHFRNRWADVLATFLNG